MEITSYTALQQAGHYASSMQELDGLIEKIGKAASIQITVDGHRNRDVDLLHFENGNVFLIKEKVMDALLLYKQELASDIQGWLECAQEKPREVVPIVPPLDYAPVPGAVQDMYDSAVESLNRTLDADIFGEKPE